MGSRTRLAAVAALLALAAAACANGDASENQVRDAMLNAGIDSDSANCVANQLRPDDGGMLTQEELNNLSDASDIGELSGERLERDPDQDMAVYVREVLDDCVGPSDATVGDTGDEPDSDADTTDDSDTDTDETDSESDGS